MKAQTKKVSPQRVHEIAEEIVERISEPFRERIKELEAENKELREKAKGFADKELKKEIEWLKERLDLSFGEFASQKELKAFKEFCKKHKHAEQMKGMEHVAGWVAKYPYVIEEATGLGHMVKAVCPICGDKKDITDIRCW